MNGYDQRRQNDQQGLAWINAFGGLRTAELGRLMWKNDSHARTRADRVARSWLERGLILARPLPEGAGRLLVLAEPGARLLREKGVDASTGKDIGETRCGVWVAPASWKHDLLAAGVLAHLYENGYDILPERDIRKRNPGLAKVPDGLAWRPEPSSEVYWLEVENARKSGKSMLELSSAFCKVNDRTCPSISGIKPTRCMVAFVPTASDERNYQLNHRARVTAAIRRTTTNDVTVIWASCSLLGCGVSNIAIDEERIAADPLERMMKIMQTIHWVEDESKVWSAHYGDRRFYLWEDQIMGWTYQLNDEPAHQADSRLDALRGCARLLNENLTANQPVGNRQ